MQVLFDYVRWILCLNKFYNTTIRKSFVIWIKRVSERDQLSPLLPHILIYWYCMISYDEVFLNNHESKFNKKENSSSALSNTIRNE